MREFFIFEVRDEFKSLYYDKQNILYNIFYQIYNLKKEELNFGYSFFRQLTKKIDKDKTDRYIFIKYHQKVSYNKKGNIHCYNNKSNNEISTLVVKRAYMYIKTNYYDCFFFGILNSINNTYFVVDFKNQDYFFLDNKKILV